MSLNLNRWREYLEDIESPDSFIDWGFYGLISICLQRRVWVGDEAINKLYPNLYICLVGLPAVGKGRVLSQVSDLIKGEELMRVDAQKQMSPLYPYGADVTTWQMLTFNMGKAIQIHKYKDIDNKEKLYVHSSYCLISEELGVLLNKETDTVVNILQQCYDSRNCRYDTKKSGCDDIRNVCVSFLAGTNPEFMGRSRASQVITQGLSSRFIFVYEPKPRKQVFSVATTERQKIALREIIPHLKKLHNVYGEVKFSKEAYEYAKDLYEGGQLTSNHRNEHPVLSHYFGRKKVHMMKLATVMNFMDTTDNYVISLDTMKMAVETLNKLEPTMHQTFGYSGNNEYATVTDAILKYIKDRGDRITNFVSLWLRFYNDIKKKEDLQEILNFLETTKQIRKVSGNDWIITKEENEKPLYS